MGRKDRVQVLLDEWLETEGKDHTYSQRFAVLSVLLWLKEKGII